LATKAASDFSLAIYESKLTNDPDTLASFLSAHQVKEVLLNPFTQAAGPAELNNSADVTTAAFKLDGERFYSDAVPVIDGAVVLLWKDTLPPRTPLMSEVQYMVSTDYMENEKRKLFVELGRKAKSLLETRLKAGVDLATAVKAVSDTVATPIEAKMLTPFSAANPPAEGDFSYYNTLDNLEQGGVSDMIITREKGVMVYAAGKKLPDLTKANPQYETTRNQIAAVTARMGANKILEEMVERELKKSEPKLN